jgi:preprotein translocase subunit YajC
MFETAYAAEQAAPDLWATLLPFALLIVAIYFILLRPQQKRNKQHREMLAALQKGDEIVTIGGIVGSIARITDDHVIVTISGNVEVPLQKHAVQTVLPKGTIGHI